MFPCSGGIVFILNVQNSTNRILLKRKETGKFSSDEVVSSYRDCKSWDSSAPGREMLLGDPCSNI